MLFQIVGKCLAYSLLYVAADLAVTQLRLCLSLELRFCHFHTDDGCQTFAEVLTAYLHVVLGKFLQFLGTLLLGVCLQGAGECSTETGYMCTAFYCVDVVDI